MKADSEKYQLRGSAAFTSAGRTQVCMHFMYKIILLQDNKSIQGVGVTAGAGGCKSEAVCAPGALENRKIHYLLIK